MKYRLNTAKAQTALNFVHDFKEFAVRDNVVDTAVGIIIGSSLTNIVSSLVKDILMPPLGILMGGIHLHHYKITIKEAVKNSNGNILQKAVTLNVGSFLQTIFDFMIIAGCLYIAISLIKNLKKRYTPTQTPQKLNKQEELLTQIRDLLAKERSILQEPHRPASFNQSSDNL